MYVELIVCFAREDQDGAATPESLPPPPPKRTASRKVSSAKGRAAPAPAEALVEPPKRTTRVGKSRSTANAEPAEETKAAVKLGKTKSAAAGPSKRAPETQEERVPVPVFKRGRPSTDIAYVEIPSPVSIARAGTSMSKAPMEPQPTGSDLGKNDPAPEEIVDMPLTQSTVPQSK